MGHADRARRGVLVARWQFARRADLNLEGEAFQMPPADDHVAMDEEGQSGDLAGVELLTLRG